MNSTAYIVPSPDQLDLFESPGGTESANATPFATPSKTTLVDSEWKVAHKRAANAIGKRLAKREKLFRGKLLAHERFRLKLEKTSSTSVASLSFVNFDASTETLESVPSEKPSAGLLRRIERSLVYIIFNMMFSRPGLMMALFSYIVLGGWMFMTIEGRHERRIKNSLLEVRKNLYHRMWNYPGRTVTDDAGYWSLMRLELLKYDRKVTSTFNSGITTDASHIVFDFWGSLLYCATIITTIGYGHISPATTSGRVATIAYALLGIPLFLVVMVDLGSLVVIATKASWIFYHRIKLRVFGHHRLLRHHSASFHIESSTEQLDKSTMPHSLKIADDFSVPPLFASCVLVVYALTGMLMYMQWEDWSYLDSFYFIFISISTIGFGDVLPKKTKQFMASSIYLLLGLSLVTMVIHVFIDTLKVNYDKMRACTGKPEDNDEEEEVDAFGIPVHPSTNPYTNMPLPSSKEETKKSVSGVPRLNVEAA